MSDAVELVYDSLGEGPPLVILHGLFGWARNWQNVARQLASHHQVITVDARNHGRSPHTEAMDYTRMSADLAALLARLELAGSDVGEGQAADAPLQRGHAQLVGE